jgi:aspartyl-tRNA(Asn)/glutamyl-tRNA(Gln) amidotransferase subunit C
MSLSLEEVHYIANLAQLALSEDELKRYRDQLSAILDYFRQLENLDTEDVPPTTSFSAEQAPLRPDQTRPSLTLDELLDNAPDRNQRLFRVPPIFE